jgi:RNA polymerase sigma-70 factor (ECF subfamily)
MTVELLARAQAGDADAFAMLVEPHRGELRAFCYRMLGSFHDAEDAVQETLLAAWRALAGFEARASLRTWLYRIATNRCLNVLRAARARPDITAMPGFEPPAPDRLGEVPWLQPFPDVLLDAGGATDPAARVLGRESVSLAFVTALQLLSPHQRAVLVLRDVLGYPARDVAAMLDVTVESVTSALKRARANLERHRGRVDEPPPPGSPAEQRVVAALTDAYERGDLDALIGLLTDDVLVTMPPVPFEYVGRDAAARFFATIAFGAGRTYHLIATRANGDPAFAAYVLDPTTPVRHAVGLLVFSLDHDRISRITRFEPAVLASFGFPSILDDEIG